MTQPNPSTAMARAIVDELARCGLGLAVVSPGSRSAALAIAADQHPGIVVRVALDERSGAFLALGWAKATGRPAAAVCTSGTAAANYLPAVVEADLALTPLVIISADRPEHLRGVGANQTIDQVRLYGGKVRVFHDIPAPGPGDDLDQVWRSTVSHAVGRALGAGGRPGPVHLNVAFEEPTVPAGDDGRSVAEPYTHPITGRPGGLPWAEWQLPPAPEASVSPIAAGRGLVIAGEGDYDRQGLLSVAAEAGWPVLATALAGLRGFDVVTRYHHVLSSGILHHLVPDTVMAVGSIGPSWRLEELVASAGRRLRVDRWGRRLDPARNATDVVHGDAVQVLRALQGEADDAWQRGWYRADRRVGEAIDAFLESSAEMTGAVAVHALDGLGWKVLVVGSSLPIREVDAHLTGGGTVIGNRGASGIDGLVAMAIGVSHALEPTVALSGDLSLLHDSGAFFTDGTADLVVVVLDNDGGGIFDSLPPAEHAPGYERLFVTPQGRDLSQLARFHGIGFIEAGTADELTDAVGQGMGGGTWLVRVPVDRGVDLRQRAALDEVARSAIGSFQP